MESIEAEAPLVVGELQEQEILQVCGRDNTNPWCAVWRLFSRVQKAIFILMAVFLKSTKDDLHTNGGFPEKYKRRFSY